MKTGKGAHPFAILAMVLPEHLHVIWRLPPGDADYPLHCAHQIRDEIDLARQVDYIHYNFVKHGWVTRPVDWPHSTLHSYIERGMAASDWGGKIGDGVDGYGER